MICIIANYRKDKQESMKRFAEMLRFGYREKGVDVLFLEPPVIFGSFFLQTNNGFGKWLAYLDKWVLMPLVLLFYRGRYVFKKNIFYHIADHSNAPYLFWLPKSKTLITCHDVLAIRGALGDPAAWCKASKTGILFQKWILRHLLKAERIGAVSFATLEQLEHLGLNRQNTRRFWKVVYNGFNGTFFQPQNTFVEQQLEAISIQRSSYILHVGSGLPRKNRSLLVKMLVELGADFNGCLVFAGRPPEPELKEMIEQFHLASRVRMVESPSHELLWALYAGCSAFVFPSWSEGFGWPVIEAQACGAPVIASTIQPMPEVGGAGAMYASPDSPKAFADAYRKLQDPAFRNDLIAKGINNTGRFSTDEMINSYLQLFHQK